ncbi:MAG: Ig-like domain-containing protein [Anaerolineaceae bacterium]|nr:Ig-like domain-containing protein [Anaerolineaceae bacterium]
MNKNKSGNVSRWVQTLLSLIVISSLIGGCSFPWQPTPDETDDAGKTTGEPPVNPRTDLPPALVEVSPLEGSIIALQQPITLYFNQAMDADSVEAALHFEPSLDGSFQWEDDRTLIFTPDQPISPDTILTLTIDTDAQAANHQPLQEVVELQFTTASDLRVLQVVPAEGTEEVDPESAIFTSFNQPVVPLGGEAEGEPAFTLTPEIPGEGYWLNTSTYIFYPEPSMNGGTSYTLHLNDELLSTSGAGVGASEALTYTFTTTTPQVLSVLPLPDERIGLAGPVEIRFNIRMDAESVEEHFTMAGPDGAAVPGTFEWDEDWKTMSFTPDSLLTRNASYSIHLGAGAESYGGLALGTTIDAVRQTAPAFSIDPYQAAEFQSYYANYGQYRLFFTTPLDRDTYKEFITLSPDVSAVNLYLSNEDKALSISGYFEPETRYALTLDTGLQDIWGGTLGEPITYNFATPPAEASLSIITGETYYNLVFIPAEASELALQATNINTLTLEISPISLDDLETLMHPDNYDYRQVYMPDSVEVFTQNLNLTPNKSQIITVPLAYQGHALTPGVYFLGVSSPDISDDAYNRYQKLFLVVSENHLVMKVSSEQALVWATQLNDFSALQEVEVSIYTTEGELLTQGTTDSDGLFVGTFDRFTDYYSGFYAVSGEPGDADFAFAISGWTQRYALYEQGIRFDTLPAETDVYIYTDRPIYRPGDAIYFKAAVFNRDNGLPVESDLDSVNIIVYGDPGMSGMPVTLYDKVLTLSDFGTVEGSVTLSEDAPPGYYWIDVVNGEEVLKSLYFDVAAYRKPDIEVSVELSPEELMAGETLTAEVQADYYFGLPASGLTFSWALYRENNTFFLPGYQTGPEDIGWLSYAYAGYSPYGEIVASGNGETDARGQAKLTFTETDLALADVTPGSSQQYILEVTVADETGFTVSYHDSTVVHPDDFYIGVQTDVYFGVAESPFDFNVQTVDWEGEPVGGKSLQAVFETIEWEVEETNSPDQPYRYIEKTEFVASASPVTGADGKVRLSFTPETPGTYRLTLRGGNAVTQVLVWVSGSASAIWPKQSQNQVKLTPDADSYQAGKIASVFLPNPFATDVKALITVERGEVMTSRVVNVSGAGYRIEIPLTDESIPNVYLSVVLLGFTENGDPDYRQGVVELTVAPVQETLDVTLTLNPTLTEPGETVEAILTVRDSEGNPVQGEFSVAVVDKAVLALLEANSESILEAFYGNRPLSVQTSISLSTYAAQLALESMDAGLGGGGGDGAAYQTIREDFPDTALWLSKVVTGVDGTARLEIPLPDSLTTWVVDVRGLTAAYQVGQAEAEIVTQKALMIQPVTPRFLVEGDKVEVAAMVYNNTLDDLSVDVSLQGSGFTLTESTEMTRTVPISAGDNARVAWWITVESGTTADLVFRAKSGDLTDASRPVWGDLQVLRYTVPQTFSTSGHLTEEGGRLELVSLPVSIDPTAGNLTVELTPTLISTLVTGLEALKTDHATDTVSVLSRLLANLNTYVALRELEIDSPQLETDLEELITTGLRQLLDVQNYDGGWSWWSDSLLGSDPFITAYVLMGLHQAGKAGLDVNDYALNRTVEYLADHLGEPGRIDTAWQLDRLVFQVYALREDNVDLSDRLEGLYARRSELSPWAEALLALTLQELGDSGAQVNTLLADLEAQAIRSATGVHWESEQGSWLLPGTPIYTTAVGIYALAQLDPASTSVTPALRYLLAHRQSGNIWSSTFETTWSLMAITAALKGTGGYQADFDFSASLNDTLIASGTAEGADQLTPVRAVVEMGDLYPDSPNALQIERGEGSGTLYYRVDLETYQLADSAEPINKGISLSRAYYLSGEDCRGEDRVPVDSITLDPTDPSQTLTVVLTVNVPNTMYNLMVEDFIPAGAEVIDPNLLTSQTVVDDFIPDYDPISPFMNGWGWWVFNDPQIYDDHVLWTADVVPAGTYTLTYHLLPYLSGEFQVIPAHAWQYFFPEVQGTSAGNLFTIE